MSARKQNNRIDSVRDAVTGYAAVVLGIACFILALIVIIAIVRVVVGASIASSTATTAAAGAIAAPQAQMHVQAQAFIAPPVEAPGAGVPMPVPGTRSA